jgi:hypothetical protein
MEITPRYVARGNAVAFAGTLQRVGDRQLVERLPVMNNSASLPVTGGLSRAEFQHFTYVHEDRWPAPIVEVASGTSRAWDEERDGMRITHVMAGVSGLSLDGRLSIRRASAYLRSVHRGAGEPEIEIRGALVDGLNCEGRLVKVVCDPKALNAANTFKGLCDAWAGGKSELAKHVLPRPSSVTTSGTDLPEMDGWVVATPCRLEWADPNVVHPEVTLDGHVLDWPGFGKVYAGELIINKYARRFTMLRFELGSPVKLSAASGEVESNGRSLP